MTIRRFALGRHRSGMMDQSVAFAQFARQVHRAVAYQTYDIVFATSSRLMTAVLGARIAHQCDARLYLDIRDLFADTIKDILPGAMGRLANVVASGLERYAIRRAQRVNLVSGGFLGYFRGRYPTKTFSCITNGIDDDFIAAGPRDRQASPRLAGPDTVQVLYAGNVGEGQGLHRILPPLARALGSKVHFIVIGDGGRRELLEETVARTRLTNVEVRPPMDRQALIAKYRAADVLFLHLNDHPAFHKVLPSKIFEYAALGKPILAGVGGFAAEFIRAQVPNAAVFDPCDAAAAARALASLTLEDAPRPAFVAAYGRSALSARLADDVLALAPTGRDG